MIHSTNFQRKKLPTKKSPLMKERNSKGKSERRYPIQTKSKVGQEALSSYKTKTKIKIHGMLLRASTQQD